LIEVRIIRKTTNNKDILMEKRVTLLYDENQAELLVYVSNKEKQKRYLYKPVALRTYKKLKTLVNKNQIGSFWQEIRKHDLHPIDEYKIYF